MADFDLLDAKRRPHLSPNCSTLIVYNNKIIVTGHTAKDLPSRPVPHSILLLSTLQPPTDPDTLAAFNVADPALGAVSATQAQADAPAIGAVPDGTTTGTHHRRRRRER